MWQNMGREIHLERREMAFSWISVGGNGGMRRNLWTIPPFILNSIQYLSSARIDSGSSPDDRR